LYGLFLSKFNIHINILRRSSNAFYFFLNFFLNDFTLICYLNLNTFASKRPSTCQPCNNLCPTQLLCLGVSEKKNKTKVIRIYSLLHIVKCVVRFFRRTSNLSRSLICTCSALNLGRQVAKFKCHPNNAMGL